MAADPPTSQSTTDADDLVGRILSNRYRVLAKLGEGAMGAVYVAEHLAIGRRDAIKVLRPQLAQDAEAIARFTRGTRNVSAIQHPNVCTIYDFSETPEGLRFLAMEYVEGETLKDVLDREGRLATARAIDIARQVAAALQAAHDAGVVHRDLKPGNIMLYRRPDGREVVKVVDFDIAKGPAEAEGDEVTRVGYVVGTPQYMSPEQLIGERLDGRSDLYSLGIMLFRMVSGALPFDAASTQELMVQRLTAEPKRLGDVMPGAPPGLQHALERALARKAQDRQASAAEFATEIAGAAVEISTDQPRVVSAPPELAATRVGERDLAATRVTTGTPETTASDSGRTLRRAIPIGIAAVALLVAVAYFARSDNAPTTQAAADSTTLQPVIDDAVAGDAAAPRDTAGPATTPANDAATSGNVRPPASETPQQFVFPGGVAAMLDRLAHRMAELPEDAVTLNAVRDSAQHAWDATARVADRSVAALVLAQAALQSKDYAACARWARRGLELDGSGSFQMLLQSCQ